MDIQDKNIVLIANGDFPKHSVPINILKQADLIICCDGAANNAITNRYKPDIIIGDFDSIDKDLHQLKHIELVYLPKQNENDLRKSLIWIEKNNGNNVIILGATGKREDHSMANIFSLSKIDINLKISIVTDYGTFIPIRDEMNIKTYINQNISFFCTSNKTKITASGLMYPLNKKQLSNLYEGSLNIATQNNIEVIVEDGVALIFLTHKGIDDGE